MHKTFYFNYKVLICLRLSLSLLSHLNFVDLQVFVLMLFVLGNLHLSIVVTLPSLHYAELVFKNHILVLLLVQILQVGLKVVEVHQDLLQVQFVLNDIRYTFHCINVLLELWLVLLRLTASTIARQSFAEDKQWVLIKK